MLTLTRMSSVQIYVSNLLLYIAIVSAQIQILMHEIHYWLLFWIHVDEQRQSQILIPNSPKRTSL